MRNRAFTLVEALVVLGITGIVLAIGALNLRGLNNPLQNGAGQLEGFFKQARAKAMATTSAYRVRADSSSRLVTEYARNCNSTTWTVDPKLVLELPTEVRVSATNTPTTWPVCFTSRGLADKNLIVTLSNTKNQTRQVEVMLGGGVRPR